jgi:molybdenum cofactor guanylyltransferase
MASSGLRSLVLAGGASTRMGVDKAFLDYHGEPQVRFLARALSRVSDQVCVSVRRDQPPDPRFDGLKLLRDRDEGIGPLEGLLRAFAHAPRAAWLVVAVDMPYVTASTLLRLVAFRDTAAHATSFRSPQTGLPEPVLAIYEPAILPVLENAKAIGRYSLMLLRDVPIRLIEAEDAHELWNVNDADDYREFQEARNGTVEKA